MIQSIQHIENNNSSKLFNQTDFNKEKSRINYKSNRRANSNKNNLMNRENNQYYPQSYIPIKQSFIKNSIF